MDQAVADAVWASLLAIGAGIEVWAIKNTRPGDTLSETTRRAFRVNTRAGRLAFAVVWGAFAVWFGLHILNVNVG